MIIVFSDKNLRIIIQYLSMKAKVNVENLQKRFNQIKDLNTRFNSSTRSPLNIKQVQVSNPTFSNFQPKLDKPSHQSQINFIKTNSLQDPILSKADIVKAVIKLKPYLQQSTLKNTSNEDFEDFTKQEQDLISEMLILQNNRLSSKLENQIKIEEIKKSEKRKAGCIFEIVFSQQQLRERKQNQPFIMIDLKKLQNAYAAITEILEIYLTLGDVKPVCMLEMTAIQYVQYHSDVEYEYIRIRYTNYNIGKKYWINLGFITKKQFDLFDRMLFLAKQVTRTSPGRLFDNKLLYEILERY